MFRRPQNRTLIRAFIAVDLLVILALVVIIIGSRLLIGSYKNQVLDSANAPSVTAKNIRVGMVLGAGITHEGKPYKELQARLDVGAEALEKGYVDKLIVSGDNRFENYDEPTAMKTYLVEEKGISPDKIQPDFAGRSTYESCERAAKVFGQHKLIIISVESHLPRAIFLCEHFGIESYGLASHLEANNSTRREALARVKAVYNIYLRGEPTVLGNPIKL